MKAIKIAVNIKVAWWFTWLYLPTYIFFVRIIVNFIDADFNPDDKKLKYWLYKAIKFKVK
jgi:hypothetical protein